MLEKLNREHLKVPADGGSKRLLILEIMLRMFSGQVDQGYLKTSGMTGQPILILNMAIFKINPITNKFDMVDVPLDNGTDTPLQTVNGDIELAYVDSNGRIYFRVNNSRYYINGVAVAAQYLLLETGDSLLKEDGGKIILDN